jgi:5,10-methenyltetrahydromethanopterin hydrogenase
MTDQPADLLDAVRDACTQLARSHAPVTFTQVAARTAISRTTLYRRRDLRDLIEHHRDPAGEAVTITGLATQLDQLRRSLEAVAANVRRHEEHLRAMKRPGRAS